jgi:tetratricopeptide (TPR) repeat protein
MRDEVTQTSDEEAAAEQYALAVTYKDLGMTDEAMTALEEAARSPRQRFEAASMLARLRLERGEVDEAIAWFERAAEAPPTTAEAGHALLYDLAETLEKTGEKARALAIFVELEAESGGYRDVANRINRLSKVRAKG